MLSILSKMMGFVSTSFFLGIMPHVAAAGVSESHFVSALDKQGFAQMSKDTEDLVVVFCDETETCKHLVESLKKLTVIWKGMGQFSGARFGEVSCAQDKGWCDAEGITSFPTAVHYRHGIRLASWKAE